MFLIKTDNAIKFSFKTASLFENVSHKVLQSNVTKNNIEKRGKKNTIYVFNFFAHFIFQTISQNFSKILQAIVKTKASRPSENFLIKKNNKSS